MYETCLSSFKANFLSCHYSYSDIKITYFHLENIEEKRYTGWCLLRGNHVGHKYTLLHLTNDITNLKFEIPILFL